MAASQWAWPIMNYIFTTLEAGTIIDLPGQGHLYLKKKCMHLLVE